MNSFALSLAWNSNDLFYILSVLTLLAKSSKSCKSSAGIGSSIIESFISILFCTLLITDLQSYINETPPYIVNTAISIYNIFFGVISLLSFMYFYIRFLYSASICCAFLY
jgi:hypothetical protein